MRAEQLWWLPIVVGLVFLIGHNLSFQPWALDDAFITFRYAENLAAGIGPVYNAGEIVEGYTTPLWMFLLSGMHSLGLETITAAKGLGLTCDVLVLVLVSLSHRIVPSITPKAALFGGLFTATSAIFTRWSMSGMEVPLVTLLLLSGALLHLRERGTRHSPLYGAAVGLICALASMSRPDAGLLLAVLGADRLLWVVKKREGALPSLAAFVAVYACLYGGYFAWRYSYYGWLLPNTFYVKVGSSIYQVFRGLFYTGQFIQHGVMLLGGVLLSLHPRMRPGGGLMVLTALVLSQTAYIIAVGGDVMYGYRFFATYLPMMALVAAAVWLLVPLPAWQHRIAMSAPIVLNVIWLFASEQLNHSGRVFEQGKLVGEFLRDAAPPDAVVAVNVAGTIPYYSRLTAIDTLGLNDVHIAHREIETMGQGWAGHEKGDGAYVLSREPDYVIFGSSAGGRYPRFLGDQELFESPEFHKAYDYHVYDLPNGDREPVALKIWVRRPDHGGASLDADPRKVLIGDLSTMPPDREGRPSEQWW